MRSKLLISLGLVVCLVMAFALPMCAPTPAPPVEEEKPPVEEEVPPVVEEELAKSITAFIGITPTVDTAIADFVEENLGVEVKFHHLSFGEIHAKLIAEAPRFSADMGIAVGAAQAFMCKREGWSVPHDSPTWAGASESWKDPDNYWWDTGNYSFVLIGNPDMLAEKGYTMPESWDDLLDLKWKGQIVMPSPLTSGSAFMMLYSFMTLYGFNADKGEEGLWEFYDELDKNIDHYCRSGGAPIDMVARGEFMLGIAAQSNVLPRLKEGYVFDWTIPKEGTGFDGTFAIILKGTKEEYTCKKVVDLLGTVEYAQLLASIAGRDTRLLEAPSALHGPEGANYIPNLDLGWAAENRERLAGEWKEKYYLKYKE